MTNAREIANSLAKPCTGDHRHVVLITGRAKRAEIYPNELCKEILIGLRDQMIKDGRLDINAIEVWTPSTTIILT